MRWAGASGAAIVVLSLLAAPEATADPGYAAGLDAALKARFRDDAPGCIVSVSRGDAVEYLRGYGLAEVENGVPLKPDSRIAIASVSKQFTAMAVLLLEAEGRLKLHAPVSTLMPDLPAWAAKVTVADLLYHQSGIRDYLSLQELRGLRPQDYYSRDEALALLKRQTDLEFVPGTRALYSNSGYFLLGVIVERISGQSLRHFMEDRIFKPLGMTDSFLNDDMGEVFARRVYGYTADAAGTVRRDPSTLDIVGDGGVVTTAHDLALWQANFGHNILGGGAALIARMTRPATLKDGTSTPHAAGLFVRETRHGVRFAHTGNYGGFRALVQRFPTDRLSIAILCNSDTIDLAAEERRVTPLIFGDETPAAKPRPENAGPQAPAVFTARLEAGDYRSDALDVTWHIARDQDGYRLAIAGGAFAPLVSAGPDRLTLADGWFEIVATGDGFDVSYDATTPIHFLPLRP